MPTVRVLSNHKRTTVKAKLTKKEIREGVDLRDVIGPIATNAPGANAEAIRTLAHARRGATKAQDTRQTPRAPSGVRSARTR